MFNSVWISAWTDGPTAFFHFTNSKTGLSAETHRPLQPYLLQWFSTINAQPFLLMILAITYFYQGGLQIPKHTYYHFMLLLYSSGIIYKLFFFYVGLRFILMQCFMQAVIRTQAKLFSCLMNIILQQTAHRRWWGGRICDGRVAL